MSTPPRSILIVANPVSGRGRGRRTADGVAADLSSRGIDIEVRFTTERGEAGRIASEWCRRNADRSPDLSRSSCVVACGGDGTIQEVAHALAGLRSELEDDRPILGLAPAGRCNDFARALGIRSDPRVIADTLATGIPVPIDLGRVNGQHFCTVATVGIDAEITQYVDEMRMPLTGTPAYLYGALRVLMRYQPRGLRIAGDFGVIERPVFLASSANTSSYGGAVPIAPGADPTDGELDLCVIEFMSKLRALRIIPTVLRGRHTHRPGVSFVRTKRLTIEAPRPLAIWADGERVADTPATIDVVPGAVRVMRPQGQ